MTGLDLCDLAATLSTARTPMARNLGELMTSSHMYLGVVDRHGPLETDRIPRQPVALDQGFDRIRKLIPVSIRDRHVRITDLPQDATQFRHGHEPVRGRRRADRHRRPPVDIGNVSEDAVALVGAEVVVDDLYDLRPPIVCDSGL